MTSAAFVTLFGIYLTISVIGYKWGATERHLNDFFEDSIR